MRICTFTQAPLLLNSNGTPDCIGRAPERYANPQTLRENRQSSQKTYSIIERLGIRYGSSTVGNRTRDRQTLTSPSAYATSKRR
jgi:hypothetical protein